MKVKVLFYSYHKQAVGRNKIEVEVAEGTTIEKLVQLLKDKYPMLRKLTATLTSLNQVYADGPELLKDGDEVALFPPVGGG